MKNTLSINGRKIGEKYKPFIIPEIGINHEGNFAKAKKMIKDAHDAGAECVKFQSHIIENEMIENNVIPKNANESIWEIMKRCSFNEEQEKNLKKFTEELGLIYMSTPFSRDAANRLEEMNVSINVRTLNMRQGMTENIHMLDPYEMGDTIRSLEEKINELIDYINAKEKSNAKIPK